MKNLKIFFCMLFLLSFFQANVLCMNCMDCMKCLLTIDCETKISKVKRLIKLNFIDDAKKIINKIDKSGKTLLHEVCESGQLRNLEFIIKYCNKEIITKQDEKGDMPLSLVCNIKFRVITIDRIEINIAAEMAELLLPYYDKALINHIYCNYSHKNNKNLGLARLLTSNCTNLTNQASKLSV